MEMKLYRLQGKVEVILQITNPSHEDSNQYLVCMFISHIVVLGGGAATIRICIYNSSRLY